MTFKTVLAVTDPGTDNDDLKMALALCEGIDAHLAVLAVAFAAPPPIGEYAAVASDGWLKERQADMRKLKQRCAKITSLLASSTVSSDVSSEYLEENWADEAIGRRARYSDIVLLGPKVLARETLKAKTIEGVLFSSGKPMLVVPEGSRPDLKPKRVMVAWDSRVEASNAVGHALALLKTADDVRVVLVDPFEGESEIDQGAEPGADIAAYLVRHGIKVTVERLPAMGNPVAEVLAGHALDTAAQLLVMGGYGHSRLRERIFGGVTRSMLESPPLPIFMAR